jgi:hypothetical protein
MWAGRILFVINALWLFVNFGLSLQNLRQKKRERELFIHAEALVAQAEETLVQAKSNEFRVCPVHGGIVQGMCPQCAGVVPSKVSEG